MDISICIPIRNRKDVFELSFEAACVACDNNANVEIVVSDNCSEDDIYEIVKKNREKYNVNVVYSKTDCLINQGANYIRSVNLASGKYAWIIGSDDFIKKDSITNIQKLINENHPDFICINYDIHFLSKNDTLYTVMNEYSTHCENVSSSKFEHFQDIISPKYDNVFLGALMVNIFKREIWNSVDIKFLDADNFNTLISTYPHCFIFANSFLKMDSNCLYCSQSMITVGEGVREWADTSDKKSYWNSSLPVIYLKVLEDLLLEYKKNGLSNKNYKLCKNFLADKQGQLFIPFLFNKHIKRIVGKDFEYIKIKEIFKNNYNIFSFYKGVFKYIIKELLAIVGLYETTSMFDYR